MPDLFPTTARTWIDEQFATIELGGDAAVDARVRLRSHVMERYARPLSAYVRATSIARMLSLDADDVVHDFLAHRVSRDGFFERYAESNLPLRRYLMNGVLFVLRERLTAAGLESDGVARAREVAEHAEAGDAVSAFERAWGQDVLALAAERVAHELEASGEGLAWTVFRRHFLEGRTYEQIADEIGLASHVVRNEVRRAGRRLDRVLHDILRSEVVPESEVERELRRILDGGLSGN